MATRKPRVNVVLEPRLYAALRRVGSASGKSMSEVIRGFLDPSLGELERIADALERVKELEREGLSELDQAKEDARTILKSLMPSRAELEGQISMFGEDAPEGPAGPPGATGAGDLPSSGRKQRRGKP